MRAKSYGGYHLTARRPASSAAVEHWWAEGPDGPAEVYLGPEMLLRRARALPVWGPFADIITGQQGLRSYVVVRGRLHRSVDDLRQMMSPGACVAFAWHLSAALAEIHEQGGAHGALHPGWTGVDAEGRLSIRPALTAAVRGEPDGDATSQATDCIQLASILEALELERIDEPAISLMMRGVSRDRARLRLQPVARSGRASPTFSIGMKSGRPPWSRRSVRTGTPTSCRGPFPCRRRRRAIPGMTTARTFLAWVVWFRPPLQPPSMWPRHMRGLSHRPIMSTPACRSESPTWPHARHAVTAMVALQVCGSWFARHLPRFAPYQAALPQSLLRPFRPGPRRRLRRFRWRAALPFRRQRLYRVACRWRYRMVRDRMVRSPTHRWYRIRLGRMAPRSQPPSRPQMKTRRRACLTRSLRPPRNQPLRQSPSRNRPRTARRPWVMASPPPQRKTRLRPSWTMLEKPTMTALKTPRARLQGPMKTPEPPCASTWILQRPTRPPRGSRA